MARAGGSGASTQRGKPKSRRCTLLRYRSRRGADRTPAAPQGANQRQGTLLSTPQLGCREGAPPQPTGGGSGRQRRWTDTWMGGTVKSGFASWLQNEIKLPPTPPRAANSPTSLSAGLGGTAATRDTPACDSKFQKVMEIIRIFIFSSHQ